MNTKIVAIIGGFFCGVLVLNASHVCSRSENFPCFSGVQKIFSINYNL